MRLPSIVVALLLSAVTAYALTSTAMPPLKGGSHAAIETGRPCDRNIEAGQDAELGALRDSACENVSDP